MKKVFVILVAIAAIMVIVNSYYQSHKNKTTSPKVMASSQLAEQPKAQAPTTTPSTDSIASSSPLTKQSNPVKTYTMKEVASHGADPDSEECWTVIHGKVYDILDFATNSHPGGEVIFDACGKDATKLFETRPTGSKTPHSAAARKILEKYYIGDLKNN